MSYDEWEEYDNYEPTEVPGLENAIKIEASAIVDVESMRVLIRRYVEENYEGVIKRKIQYAKEIFKHKKVRRK